MVHPRLPRSVPDDGGAEGNRTPDLLIANEALSQLSYSPIAGSAALVYRRLQAALMIGAFIQVKQCQEKLPRRQCLPDIP